MRKFLIATHAEFAQGIYSALRLITGEQERIRVMCAYTVEGYDIKKEIAAHLESLSKDDELIVMTDVFGGSVNNEFMSVLGQPGRNVYLVAGINLPLLINLVLKADSDEPASRVIETSVAEAREAICFCNQMIEKTDDISDEEF